MNASEIAFSERTTDGFCSKIEHPLFGNNFELNLSPDLEESERPSTQQLKAVDILLSLDDSFLEAFDEMLFEFQDSYYAPEEEDDPVVTRANIRDHYEIHVAEVPSHAPIKDHSAFFFLGPIVSWNGGLMIQVLVGNGKPLEVRGLQGCWISGERWIGRYPEVFPQKP